MLNELCFSDIGSVGHSERHTHTIYIFYLTGIIIIKLRSRTKIVDVGTKTVKWKRNWAGGTCADRWAKITTNWVPCDGYRSGGRPKRECETNLRKIETGGKEKGRLFPAVVDLLG